MKNFLKVFLTVSIVGIVAYTGYEVSRLSNRIHKIENKLGGPKKIAYTEKETVEKALDRPVFGNRHHYWHMNLNDVSDTALIHSRIGLIYDSSISFERCAGFRYGACSPFHLYDSAGKMAINTLQLPVTLMDDHLARWKKYSFSGQYQLEIDGLIDSVRRCGGVFVADYHNRGLNDTFYPVWSESYKYLLRKINERNDFYCDTPINIAKYWLAREEQICRESTDEDGAIN